MFVETHTHFTHRHECV